MFDGPISMEWNSDEDSAKDLVLQPRKTTSRKCRKRATIEETMAKIRNDMYSEKRLAERRIKFQKRKDEVISQYFRVKE